MSAAGHDPGVGSFAEEASKLIGALSRWAVDHGDEAGDALSDWAGQAASLAAELNEHRATEPAECLMCPICLALRVTRQLSPEVKAHMAAAATSLVSAVGAMMATEVPHEDRQSHPRSDEDESAETNDTSQPSPT